MMMSHPLQWATRPGRLLLVALAAVLALTAGSLVLAQPALGANGPKVIAGSKVKTQKVPSPKSRTIARLALPKGAWFVTVTATIEKGGAPSGHVGVNCRLQLGSRADRTSAVPGTVVQGGDKVPILLTVAGRLGSSGKAKLSCVGEKPNLFIYGIRMNALRVGKLTTLGISPSSSTSGSGKPRVISGKRSLDEVNGDGSYHTVASLPLSKGAWWIVAKGTVLGSDSGGIFGCRLVAGADYDQLDFGLRPRSGPSEMVPLGLQVVHRFSAAGMLASNAKAPMASMSPTS